MGLAWISKVPAVRALALREEKALVLDLATQVKEVAEAEMRAPKTGHVNPRTGGTRSAPSEAPAVDYGDLIASGYVRMAGELKAEVGFADEKADELELGTTRQAPRPFLLPALLEVAAKAGAKVKRWF